MGDQNIDIDQTISALSANGFNVHLVENGAEAKEKVLAMLPEDAEVMQMTSKTLDTIGLSQAINESGDYNASRPKLYSLDKSQVHEMNKLGNAPEYAVGSANAVTEDGKLVFGSATGSQLGAYAYGAVTVIWVISTKKITKNLEAAIKRIEDVVLPLESERAMKAYGFGSSINKMLIIHKEINPMRAHIVLVKEDLGF